VPKFAEAAQTWGRELFAAAARALGDDPSTRKTRQNNCLQSSLRRRGGVRSSGQGALTQPALAPNGADASSSSSLPSAAPIPPDSVLHTEVRTSDQGALTQPEPAPNGAESSSSSSPSAASIPPDPVTHTEAAPVTTLPCTERAEPGKSREQPACREKQEDRSPASIESNLSSTCSTGQVASDASRVSGRDQPQPGCNGNSVQDSECSINQLADPQSQDSTLDGHQPQDPTLDEIETPEAQQHCPAGSDSEWTLLE